MKVAIVQEHVDIRRGGAETSTVEMARCLGELGLDVTVVSAGEQSSGADDGPFRVERVSVGRGGKLQRTVNFVSNTDRYCRDSNFDIIHAITPCFSCNVYQPRGGTYVETVNRSVALARTPIGRMIKRLSRRLNRRQRFLMLVERAILNEKRPPVVAAVSEYVAGHVRSAVPAFPRERLRVVFNGVGIEPLNDEEAASERLKVREANNVGEDERLLLYVAHNFKLKGLAELLRAAAGVPTAPDWRLLVVGRDNAEPYRRLARRLGVGNRVEFRGAVEDVRTLYAAADLLVHPTWYDPCSRVVLEALACGLPVVTTRFNGAAEIVEPGRNGEVVDSPSNTRGLTAAIVECVRPELRAACLADAPTMQERVSMSRHAVELLSVYEQAVSS